MDGVYTIVWLQIPSRVFFSGVTDVLPCFDKLHCVLSMLEGGLVGVFVHSECLGFVCV